MALRSLIKPESTMANILQSPFRWAGYEPAYANNKLTLVPKSKTDTLGPEAPLEYYERVANSDPYGPYGQYQDPLAIGRNEMEAARAAGSGAGTSGGGAGGNNLFSYRGMVYDASDPSSMNQFYTVRQGEIDRANEEIDHNAQRDVSGYKRAMGDQLNQFKKYQDLYDTGKDDYSAQMSDLYEGYGQGNVARQNFFNRLSPDTYQSAQGSSSDYATKKYGEAYGETDRARNEWKGQLDTGVERLGQDYDNWMQDLQRSIAAMKNQNQGQMTSMMDENRTNQLQLGRSAQATAFKPLDDIKQEQVDLSRFTPYTNFQSLQGSPQANMFKKFAPTPGKQDPLSQSLGYTLPTKEKDPRNAYLYA